VHQRLAFHIPFLLTRPDLGPHAPLNKQIQILPRQRGSGRTP
jgi:hypothetical protein